MKIKENIKKYMEYIIIFLKGMVFGIANVIPGVSGGTMAIVTGIYERLIGIISDVFSYLKDFKKFKNALLFLIPLGLGAVIGIVGFSNIIDYMLNNHNFILMYTFLGFVAGSFPYLFKSANKEGVKKRYIIPFAITLLMMIVIVVAGKNADENYIREFSTSFSDIIQLIVYGFIGAGTMIIPGVSGSMVMMIMGIYNAIIIAAKSLNLLVLVPFALGMALGIVVISKIIKMLLEKFYGYTYYAILGFVIGSLIFLFPGVELSLQMLVSIIVFIVSFVISYKITKVNKDN